MTTSQPITLFGGTFNPPHWGHITPLRQAMQALDIASVGLLPCNIPPHKQRLKISNEHRLAMLEIICKLDASMYVENIELKSNDVSFTVNTLKKLKQNNQQSTFFIMGTDSFQSLKTWYQWQEILQLCNIIVLNRNNQPLNILQEVTQYISCGPHHAVSLADKQALTANNGIVVSCNFPTVPVSSTLIREKIEKKDYEQLERGEILPLEVFRYIKQHQLYEQNKS